MNKFKNKNMLIKRNLFFVSRLTMAVLFMGLFLSLGFIGKNSIFNSHGRADVIYNCESTSRYIDVSMCAGYSNYANTSSIDSSVFFNAIIRTAQQNRANPSDEIIIRVPQANFYLGPGYIDFNGTTTGIFPNFTFGGASESQKPTFIPIGANKRLQFLIFAHGNDNFSLKNIKIQSDNTYAYSFAAILLRNMGGNLNVDGLECSGVKGTINGGANNTASACVSVRKNAGLPINYPIVNIKNSTFKDYFTGLSINDARQVTVENNLFDNSNPSTYHNFGSVSLAMYFTNQANNSSRSLANNNIFKGGSGYSNGQVAIAVLGESNKVDVTNNTMYDIEDTAFIIGNHNPSISAACIGAPKDMLIEGNKFYRTSLNSILLMNNVEALGTCTTTTATMRNIKILSNESYEGGGAFTVDSATNSPIYGLEIANNIVKDQIQGPGADYYGILNGTCLTLAGLKGEGNNYDDIKIHDNRFENCRAGIYLRAADWNQAGSLNNRETNYTNGQNRKNEYISIYDNTIKNDDPGFSDILVQEMPVRGITSNNFIRTTNNYISNISLAPVSGSKRCNAFCEVDSECVSPVTQQVYSGMQGTPPNTSSIASGYPTTYTCSASRCRNASDVNDENCDLNDQINAPQTAIPLINPGTETFSNSLSVSINSSTSGAEIRYTTNGTTPTRTTGTIYSEPIILTSTTTIKALAYISGMLNSTVSEATYTLNQVPSVNAGVDQNVTLSSNTSLDATVSDDGLPSNLELTYLWSKITGLGSVNFINANLADTQAGFSEVGTYVLRLSVSDGELSASDEITIVVNPQQVINTTTVGSSLVNKKQIKTLSRKSNIDESIVIIPITTELLEQVVSIPIISPSQKTFTNRIIVSMKSSTLGSTIRYTTDGSDPTELTGSIYFVPLTILSTTTIKAIVVKEGMTPSEMISVTYTKSNDANVYKFIGNINFKYKNIPIDVIFQQEDKTIFIKTLDGIVSENRIEFDLLTSEIQPGNYTITIKPRYYTSCDVDLTVASDQDINFDLPNKYYGGSYLDDDPEKISRRDIGRFVSYLKANDNSKDLNGDKKLNLRDLFIVVRGFLGSL